MNEQNELSSHIIELVHRNTPFTDIHLEEGEQVIVRLPNGWEDAGFGVATHDDIKGLMEKMDADWGNLMETQGAVDRAIDLSNCRLRCNAYRIAGHRKLAVSIRKLPRHPMKIAETGLPPQVISFAQAPKGLLLVAGATGAGKTTTLASIIDHINESRPAHIVTIEDPIEYTFERKKSVVTQREAMVDTDSFASGLREALRQRPDVIMIGEIRDRETADTALRAAESGHFVMATVHARSAVGAIQKMISFFPGEAESRAATLSNVLSGVIAQALVPSAGGDRLLLATEMLLNSDSHTAGMIADPSKHKALTDALQRENIKGGCSFMNATLIRMVQKNQISADAAIAASYAPHDLRVNLAGLK